MAFFSQTAAAGDSAPNVSAGLLSRHRGPTLGERVIESRGGLIFSVFLHILLASFWFGRQWVRPRPAPKPEIIQVQFAPPPPPKEAMTAQLAPAAASSTRQNPDAPSNAMEQLSESVQQEVAKAIARKTAPPAERDPYFEPSEEQQYEVDLGGEKLSEADRRLLASAREAMKADEEKLAKRIAEANMETMHRTLESKARELNLSSNGAKDGVARSLELRGFAPELMNRVLFKNGMEVLHTHLEPGFQSSSPIGSAVTDQGVYAAQPVTQAGIYEVVTISPKAMGKIAQLEEDYLKFHRLDPKKTQMISVKYGIGNLGGNKGYDLIILEAEHRELD